MGTTLWIVWTVIGIIGGFMVGRLVGRVRSVALAVCVGICGALLGGWLFVVLCGVDTRMEAISLCSSAAVCAVFLWILVSISPKSGGNNDEGQ